MSKTGSVVIGCALLALGGAYLYNQGSCGGGSSRSSGDAPDLRQGNVGPTKIDKRTTVSNGDRAIGVDLAQRVVNTCFRRAPTETTKYWHSVERVEIWEIDDARWNMRIDLDAPDEVDKGNTLYFNIAGDGSSFRAVKDISAELCGLGAAEVDAELGR